MSPSTRLRAELPSIAVLILGLGAIAVSVQGFGEAPRVEPTRSWLYAPEEMKYFTLGYNETIADSMWIRLIQDMDTCDQTDVAKTEQVLPPALTGLPTEAAEKPKSLCSDGWAYHMIDAITEIAPRFHTVYDIGGTMLSVLVDDAEGGLKILKKGVERYPEKWMLHFRLGFHYLYALHDIEKAAPEFREASRLGGPDWLTALSARLYSKAGQLEMGIAVLEQELERAKTDEARAIFSRKLADLKNQLRETK
ncbi:MAG: hypothetical protein V4760_15240 [Bdellovibrionota bacterium]